MTIRLRHFAILPLAAIIATSFTPLKPLDPVKKPVSQAAKPTAANKWAVDKSHSNVTFSVRHMVVSEVEGSFRLFDGTLEQTKPDFSDGKVEFTVDVSSIDTDNDNRDKHLKSDDFFNTEKFPTMKFVSTSFSSAGDNKYKVSGNLTIRDVTKPVVFDVVYGGTVTEKGASKSGFKATTTINRFDYNLKWDKATEAGGLVVSKEVDIAVNVALKKS